MNWRMMPVLLLLYLCGSGNSQIALVDPPRAGFEKRIADTVNSLRIIDTHEHLPTEQDRLTQQQELDFTLLFRHYTKEDMISASNDKSLIELVFNTRFPVQDRWTLFAPYFDAIRTTGYCRASLLAARDLYNTPELNETTCVALSEKIRAATKPGLFRSIIQDRAGVELYITDRGHNKDDLDFCRHVERFDDFINVASFSQVKDLCLRGGRTSATLTDFVLALRKAFQDGLDFGMVGVKSGLAYNRILKYDNVSQEKATEVLRKLENQQATAEESKALQDYMMHRVLDLAQEFDRPVQIHTGLQAGNGNVITNSNPVHLVNLFMEYPEVTFCLFHGAYPYGPELGTLAKNFPNVYIDLCWDYIISPAYSIRNLDEWLETVPANKIMAFGGDYSDIELVYSHAKMARLCVTKVLTDKVRSRYMTEVEAINIAKRILRENAINVFKLHGKPAGLEQFAVLSKPGPLADWWKIHKSKEGFVKSWQVVGPFEAGEGLDQARPPEQHIDFEARYQGLHNQVGWCKAMASESGYLNFISYFSQQEPKSASGFIGMVYAYTEIESPDDRQATVTLGSNDGAKVWLNGQVIYNHKQGRNAVADQDIIQVTLRKGVNPLLAKVENIGGNWGLYVRVVDPDHVLTLKSF